MRLGPLRTGLRYGVGGGLLTVALIVLVLVGIQLRWEPAVAPAAGLTMLHMPLWSLLPTRGGPTCLASWMPATLVALPVEAFVFGVVAGWLRSRRGIVG